MKNVALFTIKEIKDNSGGVERFNKDVVNILSRYSNITVFPYYYNKNSKNEFNHSDSLAKIINNKRINILFKGNLLQKWFAKIEKKYDKIIISGGFFYLKKIWKSKKVFFIVHAEEKAFKKYNQFFLSIKIIFNIISFIFNKKTQIYNPYKKNIENFTAFTKKDKASNNFYYLPVKNFIKDSKKYNYKLWKKRSNNLCYVGRLEQKQKNIKYLNKIANKKYYIDVYGTGPNKNLLQKNKNIFLNGHASYSQLEKIYDNYKIGVVTSYYEGMCYVISELISHGIFALVYEKSQLSKFYKNLKSNTLIRTFKNLDEFQEKVFEINKINSLNYQKNINNTISLIDEMNNDWKKFIKLLETWVKKN